MKQVRDLAYVADDCVKLYRRDLAPPEPGFWPWLCHIPTYVSTMPTRHRLAKKIHKLKERVREVGERRQRYDVKLPDNQQGGDNRDDDDDESLVADGDDERRKLLLEDGLRALDVDGGQGQQQQIIEVENAIIGMLPKDFVSKDDIHKIVTRCLKESDLGLVPKDQQQQQGGGRRLQDGGDDSMEEAGERCFDELVSRGFISPAPPFPPAGLKIKSCIVDPSVKTFISNISKSDNFIDDLPTHLQHQIDIRKLAQKPQPQQHKPWWWCPLPTCINCIHDDDGGKPLPPMDERVKLLKKLPEEYRLNVLDLRGCTGLTMRHLTSICELVPSLKYLSLRKTNVFWLPSQMSNLLHLETLDIRDTRVQAKAMRNIFLQELRHLLAGGGGNIASDAATQLSTVKIPKKIGKNTEILRHV
uniref:Disease resistance R13L4/SHOC-2-like LRR domain-containing protein n=1 Tax=Oryza glumipatula TaxID=40148 RepID=A0A0E0BLS3_9ORYZ